MPALPERKAGKKRNVQKRTLIFLLLTLLWRLGAVVASVRGNARSTLFVIDPVEQS